MRSEIGEKHGENIVESIESSSDLKDKNSEPHAYHPRLPDIKFENKDIEHLTKKFSQPPELNEKGERKMVCPFSRPLGGNRPEVKEEEQKKPNNLGDDDSLKEDEEFKQNNPNDPEAKKNSGFGDYKQRIMEFAKEKRTLIGVAAVSALAIGGFFLKKRRR